MGGLITLGLAVVIGLLVYSGLPGRTTKADFRVIGISPYSDTGIPPNAFGCEDAEAFVNAHAADLISDNKTGSGLRLTLETFSNSSTDNSNLVVLLSLHGMVAMKEKDSPRALFLAVNATPDSPFQADPGDESPVVRLDEVLGSLKKSSAQNLLLLIDAGRLGPNWRLGHLSNDLPSQIKSEVEALGLQNLQVIVSTNVGETSWTMDQSQRSVFSYYVLEGLNGAADGWHTTESGVNQGDATQNQRISCSELASYLQHHVQKWANQHRGVTQSVVWLGARQTAAKFDLVALQDSKEPASDTATEEKPKEASATDKADATEKSTESDPGSAAAVTSTSSTPESSPPPAAHEFEAAFGRLDKLWEDRDTLRQAERAALFGPRSWRALQTYLLRSERLLLCQVDARTELDEASDLMKAIKTLVSGESVDSKFQLLTRSSLPVLNLTLPKALRLADTERKAIRKLCEDAWKLDEASATKPVAKPTEPAPADAEAKPVVEEEKAEITTHQEAIAGLVEHLAATSHARAARLEIADVLVEQVTSSTQLSERSFRKCLSILELVGETDLPSELGLLKRLAATALRSKTLDIRWDADFAKVCCDAVKLRVDLERFAAGNSDLLPWLGDDLNKALRHATAMERWIEHGGKDHAGVHLKLARTFQRKLADNETQIRRAVVLRATLMTEIPDFARWIASRMENDPTRCQKAGLGQPARELMESRGRFSSLELSPLEEQEERNLLQMVLGVRELNRLLDDPTRDAKTLGRLAVVSKKLDENYGAFQDVFNQHVTDLNRVALEEVTPAQWRQISLVLEVPWVSNKSRSELRKRLRAVKPSTSSSVAETKQRRELAGVWQAFWAIQSLSLAVPSTPGPARQDEPERGLVELKSLWTRWSEFVNADAAGAQQGEHAVMVARLRLGKEINRAWRQIADELSDSPPDTAPSRDRQQALLARSLDGADATDPRLEFNDSKVRGSRVSSTAELLERRKEWSRSQRAPGWLENWLPQSIDCALKTGPSESGHEIGLAIPKEALDKKWTLAFEGSSKIHAWLNGTKITRPVSLTEKTRDGYRIKLDPDVGYSRKWLTIALLDESQFPVALERIPVIPPFDPNKWRIVFLGNDERKAYLADPGNGRNELVAPESGTPVSILRLPPSPFASATDSKESKDPKDPKEKDATKTEAPDPSVHELTPFLVRPENDDSKSVVVTVFQRSSTGKRQQFLHGEFPLGQSERLIPLVFKTAADKPLPPTDLSNGFVFELELQGDAESKKVTYRVQPDFWHPRKILRVIDLKFEDLRLSVELGRQALKDPQLPRSLDVELSLPPELQAIATDESYLKGKVSPQGETLFVEFDKADLERLRGPWRISLKVAGFPRAFSWILRHGFPPAQPPSGLRIIAPAKGPVFERDKPDRLVIDINSNDLDNFSDPWKLDTGWSIRYRFTPRDPQLPSPLGQIALRYPVRKRFGLELTKTGSWKLRGQVGDHAIDTADDTRFPNRPGRYSLRAVLESKSGESVSRAASMEIGVDTARSTPRVTITDVVSRFEIGSDLEIEVTASDGESGIRQLVVGFDKNKDDMLSEKEVLAERHLAGPDMLTTTRFTLTVPKAKLPQDVGKHKLLVRATNGIEIPGNYANRTITFALARGFVTLKGTKTRAARKLTLKGPGGYSRAFTVGRSAINAKNSDTVVAGDYTITDDKSGKILWTTTVKPREKLTVTIDFSDNSKTESRSR